MHISKWFPSSSHVLASISGGTVTDHEIFQMRRHFALGDQSIDTTTEEFRGQGHPMKTKNTVAEALASVSIKYT